MHTILLGGQICYAILTLIAKLLDAADSDASGTVGVSEVLRCDGCGAEPWVIRWGSVRIGQDLAGYYSIATNQAEPILVCRECWERGLGIADPAG